MTPPTPTVDGQTLIRRCALGLCEGEEPWREWATAVPAVRRLIAAEASANSRLREGRERVAIWALDGPQRGHIPLLPGPAGASAAAPRETVKHAGDGALADAIGDAAGYTIVPPDRKDEPGQFGLPSRHFINNDH
jgi:hypothetical protein